CCFNLGLGDDVALNGIVVLLLRDGLLFRQGAILIYIQLCLDLARFCLGELSLSLLDLTVSLRQLSFSLSRLRNRLLELSFKLGQLTIGLVQSCLKWPRIDLKKQLPFFYKRA